MQRNLIVMGMNNLPWVNTRKIFMARTVARNSKKKRRRIVRNN
jgi:hypothetical protein